MWYTLGMLHRLFNRTAFYFIGILVGWSLHASTADALVINPDSGSSYPYQRWVDQAQAPLPAGPISVYDGHRPEVQRHCGQIALGCSGLQEGWIFVRTIPSKRIARLVFLHELGHTYGNTYSERFAQGYAYCARYGLRAPIPRPIGYRPICKRVLADA